MIINTTRFGDIEVSKDSVLSIPNGMLGLDHSKEYVLLEDQPDTPFKWLQSIDDPALAFIVVNPMHLFENYDLELSEDDVEFLGLQDPADAAILTTVTIDANVGFATTNLLGPLVMNSRTLCAKQIVLKDERYGTKHVIGQKICEDEYLQSAVAA